ncbi:MAG: lamin tail domain-containing protein [Bacteroidota bacterium]|nr:lamin tail domain-containing protein [Bacteroidota bacterium]
MRPIPFAIPFLLFCFQMQCQSQWQDDFDDGDLIHQKVWKGDTTLFDPSSGILQLMDTAAGGKASIYTRSKAGWTGKWSIDFKFDFNPSSANFAMFEMVAEDSLSGGDGYLVEIGGSSTDQISLVKRRGGQSTYLIRSPVDFLDQPSPEGRITILRDSADQWSLLFESDTLLPPQILGTAVDSDILISEYLRIECVYTSTRSTKMYFDNIDVSGTRWVDRVPPKVIFVRSLGKEVGVQFSEALDTASGSIRVKGAKEINWTTQSSLSIVWDQIPPPGSILSIELDSLKDPAGNTLDSTLFIRSTHPGPNDLEITEIMFDPDPPSMAPATEYLEIHNNSTYPTIIKDGQIRINGYIGDLDSLFLPGGSYTVVTDLGKGSLFPPGTRIFETTLPALPNSGGLILILDSEGKSLDRVHYAPEWIREEGKREGGWALEKKHLGSLCSEPDIWAENTGKGGSPGWMNTPEPYPLLPYPFELRAVLSHGDSLIEWRFTSELRVDQSLSNWCSPLPDSIWIDNENRRSVWAKMDFEKAKMITVLSRDLYSCSGTRLTWEDYQIPFPTDPDPAELIPSEVLFDPMVGECDMVEFLNRSERSIRLDKVWIGSLEEGRIQDPTPLTNEPFVILPGMRFFISADTLFCKRYPCGPSISWYPCDLPTMPDEGSTLCLLRPDQSFLQVFSFSEDQHSPYFEDTEGISLENIPERIPIQWSSTPHSLGGSTPGLPGTQFSNFDPDSWLMIDKVEIYMEPGPLYAPLILEVNVEPGSHFTAALYRMNGSLAGYLFESEILSGRNTLVWNGNLSSGNRPSSGNYILWCRSVGTNGQIREEKLVIALRD